MCRWSAKNCHVNHCMVGVAPNRATRHAVNCTGTHSVRYLRQRDNPVLDITTRPLNDWLTAVTYRPADPAKALHFHQVILRASDPVELADSLWVINEQDLVMPVKLGSVRERQDLARRVRRCAAALAAGR